MHYYQKHIGDYIKDTAHLTMIEDGAYMRLLDLYYESDGNIPKETESVFRRLRARTDEEKKAVETVLNEFFTYTEKDGWTQKRCDEEIAAYHEKAERARKNGKLGGRPAKTDPVISGNPDETQTKANHKPLTNNHKPVGNRAFTPPTPQEVAQYCKERSNNVDPQRFVDFYESKGWMVGKNKMKSWKAAVRNWERDDKPAANDYGANAI